LPRHPDRLSAQDGAFFHLEATGLAQNVGALVLLGPHYVDGGPITRQAVAELLAHRVHRVPRLRQKFHELPGQLGPGRWFDDPHFDLDRHMREEQVSPPGDLPRLAATAGRLHATVLDRERPLWDITVLKGAANGHSALFFRWHHALVDGMSAMEIAYALFDKQPGTPSGEPVPWRPRPFPSALQLLEESLAEQHSQEWQDGLGRLVDLLHPGERLLFDRQVIDGLLSFVGLPRPTGPSLVASADATSKIALADLDGDLLRALQRRHDVSAHSLSVGLAAGALARWATASGYPAQTLRALVPVVVPVRDRGTSLGNHASFLVVDLPIAPMPEAQRVRAVAAALNEAQRAGQAKASNLLIELSDRLSPTAAKAVVNFLADQPFVDVVVSSMRGTRRPVWFAGHPHIVTYPLLPRGRRVPLMVGIVNLGGRWGFSWSASADAVPALDFLLHLRARSSKTWPTTWLCCCQTTYPRPFTPSTAAPCPSPVPRCQSPNGCTSWTP
jgi:diacylglycerol O-acyltransferase / wax synthase